MSELSPKVEAKDMELVPTRRGRFFVKLHREPSRKRPKTVKKLWISSKKLLDFLGVPVVQ